MTTKTAVAIQIYSELCKGCGICVYTCNFGVLEMSTERGKQGFLLPKVVRLEKCTGCELCDISCPDMAIEVFGDR